MASIWRVILISICLMEVAKTTLGTRANGSELGSTRCINGQSHIRCGRKWCPLTDNTGSPVRCNANSGGEGFNDRISQHVGVSALEKTLKDLGIIPEMTDVAPSSVARIDYRNNNVLGDNTGKTNTPTQVRYQPLNITWANMLPDHYYTIIMIDPDMPSRSTPIDKKTQVLHWLMVNIPGNGVGGRRLAPYIGSGPPPNTGVHRYSFFIYDEGTCPRDYTSVKPFDLIDIDRRVNWNFVQKGKTWTLRDFERWANFGRPVGGNVYQAQWDPEVDRLWRTFNKFYQ